MEDSEDCMGAKGVSERSDYSFYTSRSVLYWELCMSGDDLRLYFTFQVAALRLRILFSCVAVITRGTGKDFHRKMWVIMPDRSNLGHICQS